MAKLLNNKGAILSMAKKKNIAPGRPEGSAGKKHEWVRNEVASNFRCSEGFRRVTDMLLEEGHYKSRADVYHEALQLLCLKKDLQHPNYKFWISRIQ